jgi:hypothetical protein
MANLSVHPTGVSLCFTPAGDFSVEAVEKVFLSKFGINRIK